MYSIFTFVRMPVKDYYLILGLDHGADLLSIKKAYRLLAMEHHPDKTGNNGAQNAHFLSIKEAYEVLSNPALREKYHHDCWLEKAMGQHIRHAHTGADLLLHFIRTEQYLSETDRFRMDKIYLEQYLLALFNPERMDILFRENDKSTNRECIKIAIRLGDMLHAEGCATLFEHFNPMLQDEPGLKQEWESMINTKEKIQQMGKWKIPFILLITLLLCLVIFFISR